jgi:hypothetical protein
MPRAASGTQSPAPMAGSALAANLCSAQLPPYHEIKDNEQDDWWATAICTELNQGCEFRAKLNMDWADDQHSKWSNQLLLM